MHIKLKAIVRLLLIIFFISLVLAVPLILFYVGTKKPGIDLQSALKSNWTLEPIIKLFRGSGYSEVEFRESIYRSLYFSFFVALFSVSISFFFAYWASGWSDKKAVGLSFTLLTLILLPQTYLILPALAGIQLTSVRPNEYLLIISVLTLGVMPLSAWFFYMLSGQKFKDLQNNCALDNLGILSSLKRIISELRIDILVVFLIAWAIAWGNFLVPFSLGSKHSYTAVVQIATFTTNLGRDWAMISAAGFIICFPGLVAGLYFGLKFLWPKLK